MTDLASFQRALDLYGAAVYWSHHSAQSADNPVADAQELAALLRERAVDAGVTTEQFDDAERYARSCLSQGRKPLMAGSSFSSFRSEALS
ncbi:hypothetical protein [Mycolicibacterium sp.]|uniref:hypothetical protein n=1 Tax=Mycolicibacterium sp. TaxID=2320850 RepID=UPI0037C6338A